MHPIKTYLRKRSWKPVEAQLLQPYERRQVTNPTSAGNTVREYLERRPQKRYFQETVSEGWPIRRKKVQWRIRLNYTYPWGNARHTKVSDGPERVFPTEEAADAYLGRRLRGTAITVWVNPHAPEEVMAFLEYRRIWTLRVGLTAAALGLLWLIVALGLGRSHARKERERARAASPPATAGE